jgi:hypothetical protein
MAVTHRCWCDFDHPAEAGGLTPGPSRGIATDAHSSPTAQAAATKRPARFIGRGLLRWQGVKTSFALMADEDAALGFEFAAFQPALGRQGPNGNA